MQSYRVRIPELDSECMFEVQISCDIEGRWIAHIYGCEGDPIPFKTQLKSNSEELLQGALDRYLRSEYLRYITDRIMVEAL